MIASATGLLITVAIVLRFARRELRERTIRPGFLWIRPAMLLAIAAGLIALTLARLPLSAGTMMVATVVGAAIGVVTGLGVVRNTAIAPSADGRTIRVRGNRATVGIWIAALAVRLVARFAVPHGSDPVAQLPLDCGLVVLAAAAFTTIALAFARAIRAARAGTLEAYAAR